MYSSNRLSTFFRLAILLALVVSLLPPTGAARAAGYVVNTTNDNTTNDTFCTLREAILAANNAPANANCGAGSPADDTITFSVSGTITLSSTLPNIVSGQGTLTIDGGGNITISGNNAVRVMWVNNGADLTLQNLTIANGSADFGGGILNFGTLTITDSTFSGNSASRRGGAIATIGSGALTISNTLFENNTAAGTTSFDGGGAIHATHDVTIQNSTFRGNQYTGDSHGGGAILFLGGALDITGSTFENNRAGGNGGGDAPRARRGYRV